MTTKNKLSKTTIDETTLPKFVTVYNGFHGRLVYESNRTKEQYIWEEFGDSQEMELDELRSAKSTNKAFFQNNWFMFDDEQIIDFLGVRQFYNDDFTIEGFDKIFSGTPAEVVERISKLSAGQKESALYRARELVNDGVIDSFKLVSALEECFGAELTFR